VLVIFDADDTGLITHPVILNILKQRHGQDLPVDQYLTKDNAGEGFIGLMEDGEFLPLCNIREGFIECVDAVIAAGHEVGIGTHRGYHRMGMIHTRSIFGAHWKKFTRNFFIDPYVHPCKMSFIEESIDEDFIIVDDRPNFNSEYDQDDPRIILFDQPWNKNLPFVRVDKFDENFLKILFERIEFISNL